MAYRDVKKSIAHFAFSEVIHFHEFGGVWCRKESAWGAAVAFLRVPDRRTSRKPCKNLRKRVVIENEKIEQARCAKVFPKICK